MNECERPRGWANGRAARWRGVGEAGTAENIEQQVIPFLRVRGLLMKSYRRREPLTMRIAGVDPRHCGGFQARGALVSSVVSREIMMKLDH